MEILKLELKDNTMKIEIEGEDHTLGNLLAKTLLKEEGVTYAGYRIEHPLRPRLIIEVTTNGSLSPVEAVRRAVAKILEINKEFREQFLRLLKEEAIG